MGGGSADDPYDILRFGPVRQDDRSARSGRHGEDLEEKQGVWIAATIQNHIRDDCDGVVGTLGTGRESAASNIAFDEFQSVRSDCHQLSVEGRSDVGESTGVVHDVPV